MGARDKDRDDCQSDKLAEVISLLACAVREQTEHRRNEFEWYKSHPGLATKDDLFQMEKRLTSLILRNSPIPAPVEAAANRLGSSLDKLDASIPDKPTETNV